MLDLMNTVVLGMVGHRPSKSHISSPYRLPDHGKIVVSLTSWTPRLRYLPLTMQSLFDQDVAPNEIVLWVSADDMPHVPDIRVPSNIVLSIRECRDIGSYKKLVYCSSQYDDYYIVTADDDAYYPTDWLRTLLDGVDVDHPAILCHYAMRYHLADRDRVASYSEWTNDPQDGYARRQSYDLLPVGVGGVLYPPNSFHRDLGREDLFLAMCSDADDIWFHAMTHLAGLPCRKVGKRFKHVVWPGTQQAAISRKPSFFDNNDAAVSALVARYGIWIFSGQALEHQIR